MQIASQRRFKKATLRWMDRHKDERVTGLCKPSKEWQVSHWLESVRRGSSEDCWNRRCGGVCTCGGR